MSIWILKESGRVQTAEKLRSAVTGSMQSARDQKNLWRVQLKTLKRLLVEWGFLHTIKTKQRSFQTKTSVSS